MLRNRERAQARRFSADVVNAQTTGCVLHSPLGLFIDACLPSALPSDMASNSAVSLGSQELLCCAPEVSPPGYITIFP